jgi:hypothetical protein
MGCGQNVSLRYQSRPTRVHELRPLGVEKGSVPGPLALGRVLAVRYEGARFHRDCTASHVSFAHRRRSRRRSRLAGSVHGEVTWEEVRFVVWRFFFG